MNKIDIKEIQIELCNGNILSIGTSDTYTQCKKLFKQILNNKEFIVRGYYTPDSNFINWGHTENFEVAVKSICAYYIGDNIKIKFDYNEISVDITFLDIDNIKSDDIKIILNDNRWFNLEDFLALVNMTYTFVIGEYNRYCYIRESKPCIDITYSKQLNNKQQVTITIE